MPIVECLVFGVTAGFILGKITGRTGETAVLDTMLGIVGLVAAGSLVCSITPAPIGTINVYGMFLAAIAAVAMLMLDDAISRRHRTI